MDDPDTSSASQKEIRALRQRVSELERMESELRSARDILRRNEESENRFIKQLSSVIEIANVLSMTDTVDELCLRAVEMGRDLLEFDRIGIWFRTEETDVVVGSYGVDETGQICDERDRHAKVDPTSPDGRVLLGKEPFVLFGDAPMVNALGETVGQASHVYAALWDGEKVIGHVSADNSLGNEPLSSRQCELLRIFGSLIGYLCTRKQVESERENLIVELKRALGNVKTLEGLIPICANCKKIRNDRGLWQRTEVYIREHSDADFSHSLCPECTEKLYGDIGIPEKREDS